MLQLPAENENEDDGPWAEYHLVIVVVDIHRSVRLNTEYRGGVHVCLLAACLPVTSSKRCLYLIQDRAVVASRERPPLDWTEVGCME